MISAMSTLFALIRSSRRLVSMLRTTIKKMV